MNCKEFISKLTKDFNLDNLEEKESHPGKKLITHIEEIIYIGQKLLEKFGLNNKDYSEFLEILAYFHDLGKLQKNWSPYNNQNPSHSDFIFKNDGVFKESKEFLKKKLNKEKLLILIYFILKHHGILSNGILSNNIRLRNTNQLEEDFTKNINLVDIYGIFKLADMISANCSSVDELEKILGEILAKDFKLPSIELFKEKLGKIDENRWDQQIKIMNLKDNSILIAPTGWGKTSVSLLFAFNKKFNRIFYLLPTITAIKDFKDKISKIVGENNVEYYFYFADVEKDSSEYDYFEKIFYAQYFLKPIIITSIDQFLITFLQLGKYHLKRFNFRNSILILDELHLLSPMMLKLFIHFFKKYKEIYNWKVLLMTATLNKDYNDFILENLEIDSKNNLNFMDNLKGRKRINYEYFEKDISEEFLHLLKDKKNQNKRVLIIVNTVDKAIELGKKLEKENFNNFIVFHSRFIYQDRIKKEEEILKKKRTEPHILVATQVVEVSLDISYDLLITELAPIASLIQRFGRCNRYGEKIINDINVYIFKPKELENKYYPYETKELDEEVERFIKENKNFKDEYELYENFKNYPINLKELIEKEFKFGFKAFEKYFSYFFSFNESEENIKSILEYKESFTRLVLLDPEIFEEDNYKKEWNDIINELQNKEFLKDYIKKRNLITKLKNFLIPIPHWLYWFKGSNIEEIVRIPVIKISGFKYNYKFGLHKLR